MNSTHLKSNIASDDFITNAGLKEYFNDPISIENKTKSENGKYNIDFDRKYDSNGLIGIYLILRSLENELFIYEIAGAKSDAIAPVFSSSEFSCFFSGDIGYEGLVCLKTKKFQGNEYSGFDIPIKGNIYGDVSSITINGKSVEFNIGEFYTRMKMKLKMGYNQIPVVIKDEFSNTTTSYMEVTIGNIDKNPDIYIENDIHIEN